MDVFDELFDDVKIDEPKMTAKDFIEKAKSFILDVDKIYWSNWSMRPVEDNEQDESKCDNCNNHCLITINGKEHDCYPDHESGICRVRIFDDENYIAEMGELLETMKHYDLLQSEITDIPLSNQ